MPLETPAGFKPATQAFRVLCSIIELRGHQKGDMCRPDRDYSNLNLLKRLASTP